jgi:hypothetical protein
MWLSLSSFGGSLKLHGIYTSADAFVDLASHFSASSCISPDATVFCLGSDVFPLTSGRLLVEPVPEPKRTSTVPSGRLTALCNSLDPFSVE